ncbi:MAG: nuclear transport factor 2 family protein [Hyphomicrobiales bacterium]
MIAAQDFVEIQNLYAFYNHCSDAGDGPGYAGTFTEDGALQVMPRGLVVKGRANLIAYKQADKAERDQLYRRHWNSSLHLEQVDADTVRGRCYFQAFNGKPGSLPHMTSNGVYTDTIHKVGGRWLFALRHLLIDGRA